MSFITDSEDGMERITSASSSTVKGLVLLRQKATKRRQSQSFVIEGDRLVLDAPSKFIKELYVTEEALKRHREMLKKRKLLDKTVLVSSEIMEKISDTKTPQGILAVAAQPVYTMQELTAGSSESGAQGKSLLLLLEDIQDPGNLGTMFRTAEAAGATGIIMSRGTVDVFNPKVVRSTMSSIFRQPFLYTENLAGTIRDLQEQGIRIMAACLEGSREYDRADYRPPCAVAIGNEGNGLSREVVDLSDERVRIPMAGKIESLNAAISAGILMYEAVRQRRFTGSSGNVLTG